MHKNITIQVSMMKHNLLDNKPDLQLSVSQTYGYQVCYTIDQIMHETDEK
jgi:hypothetical protein